MTSGTLQWMVEQVARFGRALSARIDGWRRARRALRELEVGRNPDGSTVVLEYHSGKLVARRPKMAPSQAPVVPFAYADLAWLERVIVHGGYAVQRCGDERDLEVRTEGGSVYVQRCEKTQTVQLVVPFIESTEFLGEQQLDIVNQLNRLSMCGRWVLRDDDALFATTTIVGSAGITSGQLLCALRGTVLDSSMASAMLALGRHAS